MSSVGSFGTFTTARLAIYVAQKGLSVTGNNIANINTTGYTRQRLDQVSFKTGRSDRYQNPYDTHVGNGAIAHSVSQLRDPYLDIRYRAENSSVGFHEGRLSGLDQVATILDEIGKGDNDGDGLLYAQFSDFADALRHIQTDVTQVNDTLAHTSADELCQLFQSAANRLETLHKNTEVQLRQEINDINSLLVSIRGLNESIQQAEIYGDKALELRDERNNYIDELSEKLRIDVTYSMVDIGLGKEVEKLTIRLGNANPDKEVQSDSSYLVDGNFCAQLTTPKANEAYNEQYALFDKDSDAYQQALKDFKKGKTVANPEGGTFASQADLDAAIDKILNDPNKVLLPFQYLDENGAGTNDPRDAEQVFDDFYNITVSDLRDKNDEAWKVYEDPKATKVVDTTGFPTKAKYNGTLTLSGVWKDGDQIQIDVGGQTETLEIGKDLLAAVANDNPKNVANAIRDVLVNSSALRDDAGNALYNISTTTTKKADGSYNIALSIIAKEAGAQTTSNMPNIQIQTASTNVDPGTTAGQVKFGTPTEETTADGAPKAWSVSVESSDSWNKGDTITVGNATLVVGKDISVNGAKNPAQLASALARKLKIDGFTVSSSADKDGNAKLIFTANDAATTAGPNVPTPTVDPPQPANLTTDSGNWQNGDDAAPGVNLHPDPVVEDNGDNTTSTQRISYYQVGDDWYRATSIYHTSQTKQLDDNDLYGKLQAVRELLSEEGEFASQDDITLDESAAVKRGIPYYRQALDLLARKFAETMNEANNGFAVDQDGNYLNADGEAVLVAGAPLNKTDGLTAAQQADVEGQALGNFIKANCAGFVKDADGNDTNVLADQFGNPLTVGGTELTTENVEINGQTLKDLDFAGVKDGKLVDGTGKEIADQTEAEFTDDAFGTPADQAKKDAATADLNKQAVDSYLSVNNGYKLGGNLFSNRGDTDDDTGITAANISVSQSWTKGDVHVVPTYIKLFGGDVTNTTQQDNALHMGNLVDRDLVYNPQDLIDDSLSSHLFEGSFQEFLEKMGTTLGNDQRATNISLATHANQALDIDTSRDSVSAVDLNDEAMDLMQYTHALNAAYRLMTTVDDMLERLITGTGVTR